MEKLSESWPQFVRLINNGVSLIPVRDKDDDTGARKVAFKSWKRFQSELNTEANLYNEMELYNTTAAAIVCGKVSGNIEIIDIDVKYRPGIDAQYFADISALYPDLFAKLRLHKTPSGGFHILYRIKDHYAEGNKKLASRPATEEELLSNPKTKSYCYLETRGEGGYALTPPSLGYLVYRDVPIPIITWAERSALIQMAMLYNESVKTEKKYEPTQQENSYYSESPFDHFNNTVDAVQLLESYGWTYVKSNSSYDMFTRPGGTKNNVHAGFNKEKRFLKVFTGNTPFEEGGAYMLHTVVAVHEFNGDKKATKEKLVALGFGKIRPEKEKQIIKRGKPLPANVSEDAKQAKQSYDTRMAETYPHGTFWEFNEKNKIEISREHIFIVANGLGYRWYKEQLYQIRGRFVHKIIKIREFTDDLKSYIREEDGDLYIDICNEFERFMEGRDKYMASRVEYLNDAEIVKDTINTAYKFFTNGYLYITAEAATFKTYESLIGLILYDDVQQRIFQKYDGDLFESKYCRFLNYAVRIESTKDYVMPIIGYLAHRYKDETMAYLVLLTEEVQNPEEGGGAGKNVFCSLLAGTTTYKNIPASQSKLDEKFLQPWNGERILCLSDLPANFPFLFLKELAGGSGLLKKLFVDQQTVDVADMPKIIAQTNYSWDNVDGGLKRRILPIEFTNFFTLCGGVDVYFGIHFPKGWDGQDWAAFDNFIALSIAAWLKKGKLTPAKLSESGWLKQFENTFGSQTLHFIQENIQDWSKQHTVPSSEFQATYDNFCRQEGIPDRFRKSAQMMVKAISAYCRQVGISFNGSYTQRLNGQLMKVKLFGNHIKQAEAFDDDEPLPILGPALMANYLLPMLHYVTKSVTDSKRW